MPYITNTATRSSTPIAGNQALREEAAHGAEVCTFARGGNTYSVRFNFWIDLRGYDRADDDDRAAAEAGYTKFCRFVVVETESGTPVCVREFYASGEGAPPYLSKAIETDQAYRRQGIARRFIDACEAAGFNITVSSALTHDGAAFMNSVRPVSESEQKNNASRKDSEGAD